MSALTGTMEHLTGEEGDELARRGRPPRDEPIRVVWRSVGFPSWVWKLLENLHPGEKPSDAILAEIVPEIFSLNKSLEGLTSASDVVNSEATNRENAT